MACNSVTVKHSVAGLSIRHGICISNDGSNVRGSVEQGVQSNGYGCNGCYFDCKLELQRYQKDIDNAFRYITISTATGSVGCGATSSSCQHLHRTFKNIAKPGKRIRLKVTFKNAKGDKVFYSPAIVR